MKKFLSVLKKIKLWGVLSTTFVLLFIVFYVAYTVTGTYAGVINSHLGLNKRETDIDIEELTENLENLGVEIEGEGAVLLKNEDALPLKGDEKLSCFFMGSANFNYTASGSGGADSSTYKTLKTALEDEGFSVNQTLWDFYTTGVGAEVSRREGKVYGRNEKLEDGKTIFKAREIPWDRYSDTEKNSFSEYNTAIFTVSRSSGAVTFPANFMLCASMNPCPCGNYGSADKVCTCTPAAIRKYRSRISGPLLDRIDIQVEVDSVKYDDLAAPKEEESSSAVRRRVEKARAVQRERFAGEKELRTNADMGERELRKYCALSRECEKILRASFESLHLSARARSRIIKVARTIADLAGEADIRPEHILEAVSYRQYDNE